MKTKFLYCRFLLLCCFAVFLSLSSCQDPYFQNESFDQDLLKKGSKPADVEQGDLYGDLIEVERYESGVPVLYPLGYQIEYQDKIVSGTIDVHNPRLDGPFDLYILDRSEPPLILMSNAPLDDEPLTNTILVTIQPGLDGFLGGEGEFDPIVLYDAEGELLEGVIPHVYPVEEGRLNLVRSPRTVLASRMTEVINNFGNGKVSDVIRDYCGRLYMIRTQDAIDEGAEDKPIDSPLENLALYYELMNYGFSRSAEDNGLKFLIEPDLGCDGFRFKARIDENDLYGGVNEFGSLSDDEQKQFVANLAAACVASASDKSNFLNFDEISYLNQFMGIPYIPNFNSSIDQLSTVECFFPVIQQPVRMMNKTDKTEYIKYRYYVDYTNFSYNRTKFIETLIDYVTIVGDYDEDGNLIGSHIETLADNLKLNDILMGDAPLTAEANEIYRYTEKEYQATTGMLGFANQADDYVQAMEVIHDNEEFLIWEMPTPTWDFGSYVRSNVSPFTFNVEESHGNRPPGKGDDETTTPTNVTGKRGGR